MLTEIAKSTAEIYAKKDWHTLSQNERQLVEQLVKAGYLHESAEGFVGKQKK
jgi:hypothetical protein